MINGLAPVKTVVAPRGGICSPSRQARFERVTVIGERLNPTGKKALQAALRAHDMDFVLREAIREEEQGAEVLDINMGLPDIDEPAMLAEAVREIQAVTDLPLQLDSASPAALERAARIYNGKPLLNSVNGKKNRLTRCCRSRKIRLRGTRPHAGRERHPQRRGGPPGNSAPHCSGG